ncbi:MAG: glycosyltransferase family 2 protein, partial [Campylobacter lanienae]|nr:glycosyltransferase family 2 protein [Campylobacter lanienae]
MSQCLDSAINQSLKDIEIIIVDDCGSDKSMDIAQEYAKNDS